MAITFLFECEIFHGSNEFRIAEYAPSVRDCCIFNVNDLKVFL